MQRCQFSIQYLVRLARRNEEIAIESLKLTVNAFLFDYGLNASNRRAVAFCGQPRAFLSVQVFKFEEAIVERVYQVGRRPPGHATSDWPIVKHDRAFAFLR
jgi:hypothetical protein